MKQTILALVAAMFMSISGNAEVRNSLTIKNNTGEKIFLAYAWYSTAEKGWISSGWYPVARYAEFRRDLDGLNLGSNTMYYYAESTDKNGKKVKWEGNAEFRVEDVDSFKISDADNSTIKSARRKFNAAPVGKGDSRYVINPK